MIIQKTTCLKRKKSIAHRLLLPSLLLAGAVAFSSCNTAPAPLPSDVKEVGEWNDWGEGVTLSPSIDIVVEPTDSSEPLPSDDSPETSPSEGTEISQEEVTATIKSWLGDIVDGSFTVGVVDEGTGILEETAALTMGGTVSIQTFYGTYWRTEFRIPQLPSEASETVQACIAQYIGRPLTAAEIDELNAALSSITGGGYGEQLDLLADSASVYMLWENDTVIVQVR